MDTVQIPNMCLKWRSNERKCPLLLVESSSMAAYRREFVPHPHPHYMNSER
uniref:Uncharacterized protein n=1 Tax=Picea sitchensis TaxID=3332 RepID=A0A6B9XXS3_PICSI|nr:hypothetical protein Q903MT_gene6897 [Picea sitchensis]